MPTDTLPASGVRCPACSRFLVAELDPYAPDSLRCPDDACVAADRPSRLLPELE